MQGAVTHKEKLLLITQVYVHMKLVTDMCYVFSIITDAIGFKPVIP